MGGDNPDYGTTPPQPSLVQSIEYTETTETTTTAIVNINTSTGMRKQIYFTVPFIVTLIVFSLLSNTWYTTEILSNAGQENEEIIGEIKYGLYEYELEYYSSGDLIVNTYTEDCEDPITNNEILSCEAVIFGKDVSSLTLLFAIFLLIIISILTILSRKDVYKLQILTGHLCFFAATLWAAVLPEFMSPLYGGISGFSYAYWGVVFAGILSYASYVFSHKNSNGFAFHECYTVDENNEFLREISEGLILFGWILFVVLNASLGLFVRTGPFLLPSSLVSLGLIYLISTSIKSQKSNTQES